MLSRIMGFLFRLEGMQSIRSAEISFDASWAATAPAWVLFGCIALAVLGVASYVRFEPRIRGRRRFLAAALRGAVLALVVFLAADPILAVIYRRTPRPLLCLVFDGTESMNIRDDFDSRDAQELQKAVGMTGTPQGDQPPSRMEYLKALLSKPDDNFIEKLNERFSLRAFVIDGEGVRSLKMTDKADGEPDGAFVASGLDAAAIVTPMGEAMKGLLRYSREDLAGLVVFSDFNHNSGPEPLGPAKTVGRPIYTVGFGLAATKDLSVTISASPVLKKAERETVLVSLEQTGLEGQTAKVTVVAEPLDSGDAKDDSRKPTGVGERSVLLQGPQMIVEFPFLPDETGRFRLVARAEKLSGESVTENNRASREINVRDDFMRLLYVAHEPNWEWRFIKEVFHRDKLVGMRGFRTFLHSSDMDVRRSNPLFLSRLDMQRGEFFANDVIFLGDVPAERLSPQFCEMVVEFVKDFGGALVVMSGPLYGPGQLAETALADMLPVRVDSRARRRDAPEGFRPRLTPAAGRFRFMQLGDTRQESTKAWDNMGSLNWYQPARSVRSQVVVLAEHPTDTCDDGETPQPLIAIRQYGEGQVVYLAFDETWRLRRLYGEKYYRQFWGQMIYQLGLGHAVGSQKRFIVTTNDTRFSLGENLRLTVNAFDEEFQPLQRDKLDGTLIYTDESGTAHDAEPIIIPDTGKGRGEFEFSRPLLKPGNYRIRVEDQMTNEHTDVFFTVRDVSLERQSAKRNAALEKALAGVKEGGKVYDLRDVSKLPKEIQFTVDEKTSATTFHLSSTWLCFFLLVLLAVGEWSLRKWSNVP